MTFEEFDSGMRRLISVYGEKAFPAERVEIVRKAVHYVSPAVWQETVSEIIGEYMHAPPMTKIKDALYATRKKMNVGEVDFWSPIRKEIAEIQKSKDSCRHCLGSGTFGAYRLAEELRALYVFGCVCRAGDLAMQLPENKNKIRQWNIAMRTAWRPEHEADVVAAPRATVTNLRPKDLNLAIGCESSPNRAASDDRWNIED